MKDNKLAKDLDFLMSLPVSSASKNPASPVENTAGAFTPGPWHLENSSRHDYDVAYRTKDGLYGGWFLSLDHGIPPNEATEESRAEFEANARLIAAAPDLYEALKNIMGLIDNPVMRRKFSGPFADEARVAARAAIAKADGR